MPIKHRRSREEILESYKACASQLGRTPGLAVFEKTTGILKSEVEYYWPRSSALAEAAGLVGNDWPDQKIDLEELFRDFALVCTHLQKIPTKLELRIAQRDLGTRTDTVYKRFETIDEFHSRFRTWLEQSEPKLQSILKFGGWRTPTGIVKQEEKIEVGSNEISAHPGLRPFLPSSLQYLNVLARGERPPFELPDSSVDLLFERRTADAFRCLGFDVKQLGQGTGRKADSLALAAREHFALIIDAKVRSNGFVLGTEDRKFLEYAKSHGKELQHQGIRNIYFVVVGPFFRSNDLEKLTASLAESPIRSVCLLTAEALMRIVEESIRCRSTFSLTGLEKDFFGNKLISD